MALEAFATNPGLAGFSTESDAAGSFCQMIKELVDNAVDAALVGGGGSISVKVVPSSSSLDPTSSFLRITVTDDGTGMEDPFSFASAFNSSKRSSLKSGGLKRARVSEEGNARNEGAEVGGEGGIKSTMKKSKTGKSWICKMCKKWCKSDQTAKKHVLECKGTGEEEFEDFRDLDDDEIGLYVKEVDGVVTRSMSPAEKPQTAGRFGVGLTLCILHSFIGTRGETVIRSTCRGSGIERVCVLTADLDKDKIVEVGGGGKKGKTKGREVPSDIGLGGTTVSMLLPSGGHEEAFPRIAEYLSRFHLLPEKSKLSLSFEAPTLSPLKLLINPKANFIDGVRSYLNKEDLEESHVSTKSILSGLNGSEVKIQITLVLEGAGRGDEGDYEGDELEGLGGCDLLEDDMDSDEGSLGSGDGQTSNRHTDLSLVRIYNNSPMLDSIESRACGIVAAIPRCKAWKKYGLKVEGGKGDSLQDLNMPVFSVRDSELTFGGGAGTHELLEETGPMPVGIRLGRILLIVHVTASDGDLTLPTLSKGRIGEDHRVEQGIEICLERCLRELSDNNDMLVFDRDTLRKHNRMRRDVGIVCEGIWNIMERGGWEKNQENEESDDEGDDERGEEEDEEENDDIWEGPDGKKKLRRKMREAIEKFEGGGKQRLKKAMEVGMMEE